MINVNNTISPKAFYRFVEFISKLCGYSLTHERYKQLSLDLIDAETKEEKEVKMLANSYNYVICNSRQTLDRERLNTIYFLLTGAFLDDVINSKLLKRYYINNNLDVYHKVMYMQRLIIGLDIKRRIEFAFLFANIITMKENKSALIPHPAIFDEYLLNTKLDEEVKWIKLIKQMEINKDESPSNTRLSYQEVIDLIRPKLDYIKRNFKVRTLCLYGSIVKGVMNESSDIDFLIDFNEGLIDFEKGNYREQLIKYLYELLKSKVDLVYFDHALSRLDMSEMNNIIVLIKPEGV